MDAIFFVAMVIAVASAVLAVTRRNPIYAAAWMMGAFFALAVIFLLLHSTFLGTVQILLYAGAILVLFVFVIMLLNTPQEYYASLRPPGGQRFVGGLCAVVLAIVIGAKAIGGLDGFVEFSPAPAALAAAQPAAPVVPPGGQAAAPREAPDFGSTSYFGHTIYDRHLVAFELISVLVLASVAATLVLGKRRLGDEPERGAGAPAEATEA